MSTAPPGRGINRQIKVRTSNNLIDSHKADQYKVITSDYGSGGDLSVLRNGKEIAFYPFGQWAAVFTDE